MDDLDPLPFDALAPDVDDTAARALFDRRRARRRRRRRAGAGLAGAAFVVLAGLGVASLVGADDADDRVDVAAEADTVPTTTAGARPATVAGSCAAVHVTGPGVDGQETTPVEGPVTGEAIHIELRRATAPVLHGEPSSDATWTGTTGELDGWPAVELEIAWFTPCYLLLVGHGVTAAELATFVDGHYLVDADGVPMLDPRGAVWPETAQSQITGELPDDRRSMSAVAQAFAREVLGWDDVIEETRPDAQPAEDGRCEAEVAVRRASRPEEGIFVHMSRAVGRRWWSVCRLSAFGGFTPSIAIDGTTATVALPDGLPPGAWDVRVQFDYGGRRPGVLVGGPSDLSITPDTTGAAILLSYDGDYEIIGGWAEPIPAGDHTIGQPPRPPSGPQPVVLTQNAVAGWWEDTRWRTFALAPAELPYQPGDTFTAVRIDGTTEQLIAGEPVGQSFCTPFHRESPDDNDIAFDDRDADGDGNGLPEEFGVAVRADWDVVPRVATPLDLTSPQYLNIVRGMLSAAGIDGAPVVLQQLLRVDLEGDGTDEVLIVAEHPEANTGGGPLAGWYGMVLLQRVVGSSGTETIPLERTTFTVDNPDNYPTFARHRVSAIADLNGDGTTEVVVDTGYFEGSQTTVFDPTDLPRPALRANCGV